MPLFEPEEFVGTHWHRFVSGLAAAPRYPTAAVQLCDMRRRLGILFRAFGGSGAIRIAEASARASNHRLGFLRKAGLGQERSERPVLDAEVLRLPSVIDCFPDKSDNAALYEWLAAWFAHLAPLERVENDPLLQDILTLRAAMHTTRATLAAWPGLQPSFQRLCAATLAQRIERRLPDMEARLEGAIKALLGGRPAPDARLPDARLPDARLQAAILSKTPNLAPFRAPRGYKPFLPIPLFGEISQVCGLLASDAQQESDGQSLTLDERRRQAERRHSDMSDRGDPLCLYRFEAILSLAEMVNLNRPIDEDDEKGSRQAADDLSDLTLGSNRRRISAKLKLDLDVAPMQVEGAPDRSGLSYPEWDWKQQRYRLNHCRVFTAQAKEAESAWQPLPEMQRQIRAVRRYFEALRPRRQHLYAQADGEELDLSAVVRAAADRLAGSAVSDNLFIAVRNLERDLSMAVLMDISLSTDAWLGAYRVIDVEKAALLALSQGLEVCGDEHAIFTFTSLRRSLVTVETVKEFADPVDRRVIRRIEGLKAGQYTRMGAALRHVTARLRQRPQRYKLLLLLTDGKPNDVDYYEGRYGIEDTRAAIREARKAGLKVFGVTVDETARDYFPYLFGRGGYSIVAHPERLPSALPALYRQLVG